MFNGYLLIFSNFHTRTHIYIYNIYIYLYYIYMYWNIVLHVFHWLEYVLTISTGAGLLSITFYWLQGLETNLRNCRQGVQYKSKSYPPGTLHIRLWEEEHHHQTCLGRGYVSFRGRSVVLVLIFHNENDLHFRRKPQFHFSVIKNRWSEQRFAASK